jgi:hypothetical protein
MLADPALGYLFVAMATFGGVAVADQPATDSDQESEFRFRFVGPKVGNRIAAVAAIGALAVAPSEPNTVWAGTGEAWVIRGSDVMGNGIYKSTDAGKSWTNMGPPKSGRSGRIIVPPDIVFACVLGRVTGPQQERGVFRTTDGGQHWARVLLALTSISSSPMGPI